MMSYMMAPTVLVVDDERRYGEGLKKALLDYGSVGAIFVDKLGDAARMVLNDEFHFDAILTDVNFEQGEAPDLELYDGLDLIEFVQRRKPAIERYAYSAHVETAGYEAKIQKRSIDLKRFFDKRRINIGKARQHEEPDAQPWNVVRADLLRKQIGANPSLAEQLDLGGGRNLTDEGVLERVVSALRPPTITYIQNLGDKFKVKIPIQVICVPSGADGVTASAPRLGILVDGEGSTPADAVDNLREVIAVHCESLLGTDPTEVTGYAELVRNELRRHLEFRNDAD